MSQSIDGRSGGTSILPRRAWPEGAELRLRVLGQANQPAPLGGVTVIGSDPETCDVVIKGDRWVSGRHLKLVARADGVVATDLRSSNGTWIVHPGDLDGGSRVTEFDWYPGLSVLIGETELRLEVAPPRKAGVADFHGLVGRSPAMQQLYSQIALLGRSSVPVLIIGDTGTGKELVAAALHAVSPRGRGKALLATNCSKYSGELVESALFGHKKGAFTGAVGEDDGLFVRADGGTLFLDELGELSTTVQPKLLRAVENKEIERVGEAGVPRKVDVRLICATKEDIISRVANGTFRDDLYERLSVGQIRVPSLVERREDIPLLVEHFVHKLGDGRKLTVSPRAMQRLRAHTWPRNVRELRHVLERAVIRADGRDRIDEGDIEIRAIPAAASANHSDLVDTRDKTMDELEQEIFRATILRLGSKEAAAKALGIGRNRLKNVKV